MWNVFARSFLIPSADFAVEIAVGATKASLPLLLSRYLSASTRKPAMFPVCGMFVPLYSCFSRLLSACLMFLGKW